MVAVLSLGAVNLGSPTAQQVKPAPQCIDAEIRRAEAEAKLATQSTYLEACHFHIDELKKKNARLGADAAFAESSLASVRSLSRELSSYYEQSKRQVIVLEQSGNEKDAAIATARAERDVALEGLKSAVGRIRRADRAKLCRMFRVGCVPKKPK